jgi:hypothetical protein
MTPEAARMLAAAGCRMVAIGVETASEESRIRWLGKPITNAVIERAAQTIRTAGMSLVTFNMVGLPGESLHDAIATLRYSRRLGASATRVTMAIPLPGTRMALDAADRGSLDPRLARDFTAPIDLSVNPYGPYYATRDDRAIENLLNLAPLVRATDPALPLAPLLRRLPRQASRPARIWMSLQEKAIYRFSLLDGLRFYLHTGNPWLRTTNYVALI